MEKKKSKWNAMLRRSASFVLVVAMLLTSVTLPQIEWQKGEATTVHGSIEASNPIFVWSADKAQSIIKSKNITTSFGYNEEETLNYLKVTNTTGTGVNMNSAYGDETSWVATTGGTFTTSLGTGFYKEVIAGETIFSYDDYSALGTSGEAYMYCFGNAWFNTVPQGITGLRNGVDTIDFSGIANVEEGQGLIHFGDANTNGLNWTPPQWSPDLGDGTRYAYFLVKYKADGYVPRMRVWGFGEHYGNFGTEGIKVYQNNRTSDEACAAWNNYKYKQTKGYDESIVYAERDFFMGDNNIQYQLIWTEVINDGTGNGMELDSFALEVNGADVNDFGWPDGTDVAARQEELAGKDLLIYEVAGFNSENDAIAYMYKDILDDNGQFTEKAYRTETLINAPQKVAIGDTVKAHTNNLIPGAVLNRGLYASTGLDAEGYRTGITALPNVSYLSSVYRTSGNMLTLSPEDGASSHQPGHVTTGNQGYLETLSYKVDSFTKTDGVKYFYGVSLGDTSHLYAGTTRSGTVDITTPLEIVANENDPSLSVLTKYTYGKTGHNYYQYDMDFAYMDALYDAEGNILDTWSIENFIYYLRSYNIPAEHLHEDDPDKINDMPGYFHTSTGSMTYDLGPVISDNYESVDFVYNNKTKSDKVTLTLYVTTYDSIASANAGTAIGVKAYTKEVTTQGRDKVTFNIPKYETADQLNETNCGKSSYVQNFAIRVETGTNDSIHTTTFDITNIVFAERHTVEVAFRNEKDRDDHNAWDFNNKAIGVSHNTIVDTKECGSEEHNGTPGTITYKTDSDGNLTDEVLVDNTNNIYYNIENLACDAQCTFITYDNGTPTVHSGSEKVSVYAVQQSDYNFAYNIDIGTVTGVAGTDTDAGKDNKIIAAVGHINYDFSMYANTVINIKVVWQNYANNIMAGMGLIDDKGEVDILDVYEQMETTTDSDISALTSGTTVTGSASSGSNPPIITGVSYVRDSNKPTYYADGTVTVTLDPYNGGQATDIYMYYGDANGTPLSNYMHFARQKVAQYARVVEFDMVENTVIPVAAKTLVIEARNMNYSTSGASENSRSARYMILLSSAGCTDVETALGTPVYTFQAVSDTHIGKTNSIGDSVNNRFTKMLNDILGYEYVNKSHGIVIDGDLTDNGSATEYQSLLDQYQAVKNANTTGNTLPGMFWTIGNHDWNLGYTTDVDYLSQFYNYTHNYDTNGSVHDINTGHPYYYAKVDASSGNPGALFIYLGDETGDKNADGTCGEGVDGVITDTQIQWLRDVLATEHVDGMPIFVFFHEAVYNTVAGSLPGQGWDGVINHGQYDEIELQLMSVLSSYEEAIYFSGHSHWDLNSEGTYYKETDMMCDSFNTGSVAYLWSSYMDKYTDGDHYEYYETEGGSQGYYVEVYANGTVLVRGRDFEDGKWLPSAQFIVEPVEDTSVDATQKAWSLSINKTEFEYGEKVILTAQGYDKKWDQFIGIKDSSGNVIQKGYIMSKGDAWSSESVSGKYYPLAFSTEIVRSSVPADMVPGVVYSTNGTLILPAGTYTAFVNGWEEIQFTVKASETTKTVYDMDITIEKDTFKYGEPINVGFGNVYDVVTDTWIGIYSASDDVSSKNYKQYFSTGTGATEGVANFNDLSKNSNNGGSSDVYPYYKDGNVAYLTPGEYYVTAIGGADEYTQLSAPRVYFTVENPEYYVESAQDTYKLGQQITLNYIASGKYAYNWGSIADISSMDVYVAVSQNWDAPANAVINAKIDKGAGTVTFDMPSNMAIGDYQVRLMAGSTWQYWCADAATLGTFSVVEGDLEPAVSVSNDEYLNGEDISITYADIYNGTFAIYKEDGTLHYAIEKTGSGTVTIDCPSVYLPNGNYYVAFTHTDGTEVSDEFTVVANNFSVALSDSTVQPGETITITYNTTGTYSGGTDSVDVSGFSSYWIRIWDPSNHSNVIGNINVQRGVENGTVEFVVPSNAAYTSYLVTMHVEENSNIWIVGGSDGRNNQSVLTVTKAYPTLTLDTTNASVVDGNISFAEGENITVNYTGSVNPYKIAIMTLDGTIRQVAYTAVIGSIKFNNGGTTDDLGPDSINGVHFTSTDYISLPVGEYKIVALDGDGNVISNDEDIIYFDIVGRTITITFTDVSEDSKFKFNEPISINYDGATKGYLVGLFDASTESYDAINDALQVAYTSTEGTIVFNNYYTDEYDNRIYMLDSSDYDVVSHIGEENLFIGRGSYYVQAFKIVGDKAVTVTDKLTLTVDEGTEASITPEIPEKNYTYVNNEYVGVNYSGAGWGYWLAVYNTADAGEYYTLAEDAELPEGAKFVDGSTTKYYFPLSEQDPFKNGSEYEHYKDIDAKAIMRAWINGDNQMVEMNNALNFSGTLDTGTSVELPMLPRHWNGVEYIDPNVIVLGDQDEICYYTVIMFNEKDQEVDRFDITVTPPGHTSDDDVIIDPDNPVVGYIGKWQSEAGVVVIDVEKGDSDTNVIEYSTKKTFTAVPNDGYKFVGWYDLTKDGKVKSLISDDKVLEYYNFYTGTITIYAMFVKVDGYIDGTTPVTEFDVNFLNDAGQVVQSIPSINGSAIDLSSLVYTPPIKVGYTFDKWMIPDVDTRDVTVMYYNANGYVNATDSAANVVSAESADARYRVIKGDAYKYDTVYKVKTAKIDDVEVPVNAEGEKVTNVSEYIWEAYVITNVTDNVKIYGKWKPASGDTKASEATVTYLSYDASGNKEEGSFSAGINVNAYVETAAALDGKTFIGWIDMSKPSKQSYTIENDTNKVEVDGETADGANVKIYANGNVLVTGSYYPIVSYKALYAFRVVGNMDLRAVYANGTYSLIENAKPAVTISRYAQYAARTDTKVNVTVNAIVTMPIDGTTNYEIVEYGYLYFMAPAGVAPTTVFYAENGEDTEAAFLSFATEVKDDSGAIFSKKVINTSNSAGQYYGSVTTVAETGKCLYVRPYAIYKTKVAENTDDSETANWTIAYGETLKIDMGQVYAKDALFGDDSSVALYDETELVTGDYVNYNK